MTQGKLILIGAGLGLVVVIAAGWAARHAAGALGAAVNPLDRENIFYSGANALGAAVSGDPEFSLGAWIWEQTHPGQRAQERRTTSGASGGW